MPAKERQDADPQPPAAQPPVILLTRPEAAARRFATRIVGLGLDSVIAPLMHIVPVAHDVARLHAARRLVLTSVHAVPAAGPGAGREAFCVGPATAQAAQNAGFKVIEGPGDARRLAPILAGQQGLLHPHGRHVTAGLPVPGMVVYDQLARDLPQAGRDLLAGRRAVLWPLFSPRSARLAAAALAEMGAKAQAPLTLLAISDAARDAFGPWPAPIPVAVTPDSDGMIALIAPFRVQERVVARPERR